MSRPREPGTLAPEDVARLERRSVEIVLAAQHPGGAYVASPTFPPYRYYWLRDGSFAADALSGAGERASAEAFFDWCAGVVAARADTISGLVGRAEAGEPIDPEAHLPCRFTLDGGDVPGEWSSFQLDGYGMWLWALDEHARRDGVDPARWRHGVEPTLRYLAAFATHPCFDWWEERWGVHTVTLAAVARGLRAGSEWPFVSADLRARSAAAADDAVRGVRAATRDGRLAADRGTGRLDGSLVACATPFGAVAADDGLMRGTVRAIEGELTHGGVHRHADDAFFGGGEWLPLAGLLGRWYASVGRFDDARAQLDWMAAQASADGELPEQASDHLLHPFGLDEWVARWGPPARPLVWSHAAFLTLARELRDPSPRWP